MAFPVIPLALAALATAALVALGGESEAVDPVNDAHNGSAPPPLLHVGWPGEAQTEALLDELDAMLGAAGVDLAKINAREITRWDKGVIKGGQRPHAFATKDRWPDTVQTAAGIYMPIRLAYGKPLEVDGYRDPQYNKKVGGAPRSRHMWMDAFDLHPTNATQADKERLVAIAVAFFNNERSGVAHNMGLGVYPTKGKKGHSSHIHVDSGGRRTWGMAKKYGADA